MWIIEDVQSSIKSKIGSRGTALEKGPSPYSLTLTIEVDNREGTWYVDVANTTTVIMLKNKLRYQEITDGSCNEIDIFFKNVKLANKYWYLPDYHIGNFSKLFVKHRKKAIEKKKPPEPMLIKLRDAERKVLVRQRLTSRRLEDIFNFAVLHALYDPNSCESSYVLSEVADLGAFKTTSEKLKASQSNSSQFHFSPTSKGSKRKIWKNPSSQYKFLGEDQGTSKSLLKLTPSIEQELPNSSQCTFSSKTEFAKSLDKRLRSPQRTFSHKAEFSKSLDRRLRSARAYGDEVKTCISEKPFSFKASSYHTIGEDAKRKPEDSLSQEVLLRKVSSTRKKPEALVLSGSRSVLL
jgi:hypothetical protein